MQARPRELLDAALAVFVEKGFDAARTDEIAARAGASKGTLYLYFRGKEDLLKTLIEQRFSLRIAVPEHEALADDRSSHDLLRSTLTEWSAALADVRAGGIFKLVFAEAHGFPALAQFWQRDVIEPSRRMISALVMRGIARGEFRRVNPDLVAHSLVLPMFMVCMHRHAINPLAPGDSLLNNPALFIEHFELVLEGLASRTPPSPHQGEEDVRNLR
jgi:AcrR family transcriptional regulator